MTTNIWKISSYPWQPSLSIAIMFYMCLDRMCIFSLGKTEFHRAVISILKPRCTACNKKAILNLLSRSKLPLDVSSGKGDVFFVNSPITVLFSLWAPNPCFWAGSCRRCPPVPQSVFRWDGSSFHAEVCGWLRPALVGIAGFWVLISCLSLHQLPLHLLAVPSLHQHAPA